MRRIAFVISSQHLIVHGGIGQFFKAFYEQVCAPNNILLDLVLDKSPDSSFASDIGFSGKIYTPETPLRYNRHRDTFAFDDSVNFEKTINFREAMFRAAKENIYDMIIVNSIDAISGIYCLGLQRFIPLVMYSHLAMMLGDMNIKDTAFTKEFRDYFVANSMLDGIIIGTQSQNNKVSISDAFAKESIVLPMPIPEVSLLEEYTGEREGVLFMGRYEQGKNPDAYIKAIKETGLKAKVMTNSTGAKKFERDFKDAGITNYEIKSGIFGKEKVDFIKSAKVYYNPSLLESFGYTMLEGLSAVPNVVVLDNVEWPDTFKSLGFRFTEASIKNASEVIKDLHDADKESDNLSIAQSYNSIAISSWLEFLESSDYKFKPTKNRFTDADNFFWSEFLLSFGRDIGIEDIQTGYRSKGLFKIIQSARGSWCSKSGEDMPASGVSLEDFL